MCQMPFDSIYKYVLARRQSYIMLVPSPTQNQCDSYSELRYGECGERMKTPWKETRCVRHPQKHPQTTHDIYTTQTRTMGDTRGRRQCTIALCVTHEQAISSPITLNLMGVVIWFALANFRRMICLEFFVVAVRGTWEETPPPRSGKFNLNKFRIGASYLFLKFTTNC